MSRAWPTILFLIIALSAQAQKFPFDFWHDGKIVLDTNDTLRGSIKYDLPNNLLQYQSGKVNESFTSRKVLFFEIFDVTEKQYRQFYSLPYSETGSYKAPYFFELFVEGKMTVLSREAVEYRTYTNPYSYYSSYARLVLVYKYFILKENGEIAEVIDRKNDWLSLMGDKADAVEKYAKENRLDFTDRYKLTFIIKYYNSLFK